MLSPDEQREIEAALAAVPQRRAACIDALRAVQRRRGWVSDESLADVAAFLGMSAAELDNVATFQSLIFRRPVGRHVILLCDSVSCWITGADGLEAELRRKLGIAPGETTADGRFTLLPVACLGVCEQAPALMVDGDVHGDVTPDGLGAILARYG